VSKALIKKVRSLHQKKHRERLQQFVIEGEKMVAEALDSQTNTLPLKVHHVVYAASFAQGNELPTGVVLPDEDFASISQQTTPSGVLCVCEMAVSTFPEQPTILYLDKISDPGNLGSIIRLVDWFGNISVVLSPQSVDVYNPKTIQATMGSILRVPVFQAESDFLEQVKSKGYASYGADMTGDSIYKTSYAERTVIVMGSESHGMSAQTKKAIDTFVAIPGNGDAESLNVAMATGIILSQQQRKLFS